MAADRVKESFDGCRLCLGVYKEPKLLDCLHSFCATCLDRQLQNSDFAYKIICPTCQMDTELKYNGELGYSGIAALTTNTYIIRKQYLIGLSLQVQHHSTSTMSDSDDESTEMMSDVESSSDPTMDKVSDNMDTHLHGINDFSYEDTVFTSSAPSSQNARGSHQAKLSDTVEARMLRRELENNTMNLRMEVLNITDAIDTINQCVNDWNHCKAELQSNIKRRSHQLQRMIGEEECRLLEQLEDCTFDGEFMEEADCQKGELHSSLLSALQAVAFTRQVLVEATPEEIIQLSNVLNARLKQPPINHDVVLSIPQIKFQIPDKSLTEIITEDFGTITTSATHRSVYSPREVTPKEVDSDAEELQVTTETILVRGEDFSKIEENGNKLNTQSVDDDIDWRRQHNGRQNGQQPQQNGEQQSGSDELQVSTTETILVSSKDFSKIDDYITVEETRNKMNEVTGTVTDWKQQQTGQQQQNGGQQQNGQKQNGQQSISPNGSDLNLAKCSRNDDQSSSSSTVSEEPLTFDRFLSLRTSLRERRNKILQEHSDSSSPGTSQSDVNCDYRPCVMQTQSTYGSASMPKPRKRIVRHHSFNSTLRNRYSPDDSRESTTSHDSAVSTTIPEKPEGNSNGHTDINGNGSVFTGVESMENYTSPNSVREYIRQKKASWRSLSLS